MSRKYISSGAIISEDGRYRYLLWREWRGTHDPNNWRWIDAGIGDPKSCLFIMLNPSTADAKEDDPTIRRCVSFAASWNFERLEVVNLFAHRCTDPSQLLELGDKDDPVGPGNLDKVQQAADRAGIIVCAWGAHGGHLGQYETVLGWIGDRDVYHLGLTSKGNPKHPLYLSGSTQLQLLNSRFPRSR